MKKLVLIGLLLFLILPAYSQRDFIPTRNIYDEELKDPLLFQFHQHGKSNLLVEVTFLAKDKKSMRLHYNDFERSIAKKELILLFDFHPNLSNKEGEEILESTKIISLRKSDVNKKAFSIVFAMPENWEEKKYDPKNLQLHIRL